MKLRLSVFAWVWILSVVPAGESLATPIRVDFAGVVATAPSLGFGFGLGSFSTVGTPLTGYAFYDTDFLHLVNVIPPYYAFDASHKGVLHVESPTETADSLVQGLQVKDAAPGTDSGGLGTDYIYFNGQLVQDYAPILFTDSTGTAISSESIFTPGSLAGWTSAELIFRTEVRPGHGPFVLSTVTLTQWSVSLTPEPGALALLGAGLLAFSLRRAVL